MKMNIYETFFLTCIFSPFQTTSEAGMLLKSLQNTFNLVSTVTYFVTIKLMLKNKKKHSLIEKA